MNDILRIYAVSECREGHEAGAADVPPCSRPDGCGWQARRMGRTYNSTIPQRGGGARFGGLPAKAGRGQTPSMINVRNTAARTADEGPFGVVAERHPQPEAHKAAAIVRRAAREHGERAGL